MDQIMHVSSTALAAAYPTVFIRYSYIITALLKLIEVNELVQVWLREESENLTEKNSMYI